MILTRLGYLLMGAVVAVAAAGICTILQTDEASTNPPITVPEIVQHAAFIDSVTQSGRHVVVRFRDDFDARTALDSDSRVFEVTLDEGQTIENILRYANVPTGEGGVEVIVED